MRTNDMGIEFGIPTDNPVIVVLGMMTEGFTFEVVDDGRRERVPTETDRE